MNSGTLLSVVCFTGLAFASVGAQDSRDRSPENGTGNFVSVPGSVGISRERALALRETLPFTPPSPRAGPKSPAVAGVLSAIAPGLGSYYAEDNQHGNIHVAIGTGAILLWGLANADCTGGYGENCESKESKKTAYLSLYVVNQVWSIFTAMKDAREFNKRP